MKNNLFTYATSELSQDAFICWLASFALEEQQTDLVLKECAEQMMKMFVPELENQQIVLTDIKQQFRKIDVLLTVKSATNQYKIIVEDKIFASEHGNQLKTYLENIEKDFPEYKIRGVYYKTGFQSDFSKVEEAGYHIIMREKMLALMEKYVLKTTNQIFLDYYAYWKNFQMEVDAYRHLPVSQWQDKQILGFYASLTTSECLEEKSFWVGYNYVANRSGGFYGLWSRDKQYICINGMSFVLYLQLETAVIEGKSSIQLCLKLSTTEKEKSTIRNQVMYGDGGMYRLSEYHFCRPHRLGTGRHMTIGIYVPSWSCCSEISDKKQARRRDVYDDADYIKLQNELKKARESFRDFLQTLR